MRRGFGELNPAQRNKGQCVKRSAAGPKESVIKPTQPPAINAKGKPYGHPTLAIFFTQLWHQQEIEADTNYQNGQNLP